jgi:hypothetical protein
VVVVRLDPEADAVSLWPLAQDPLLRARPAATLGDEGLNYGVADLRAAPFTVELGCRLTAALG